MNANQEIRSGSTGVRVDCSRSAFTKREPAGSGMVPIDGYTRSPVRFLEKGPEAQALHFCRFDLPWGGAVAGVSGEQLCALIFVDAMTDPVPELARIRPNAVWREDPAACHSLVGMLQGGVADRGRVPVEVRGTPFQCDVWRALCDIPPGCMMTYGDLAGIVGRPHAARATGAAIGANPVSLLIPCHRVVRADGALGGYRWGVGIKRAILVAEGAVHADGRYDCQPGI
ncbi:MAG: methylated-DNA--[protein]-cysteine S-methyltransferase [Pseudomonadota bacterium]|nr:methylated-DNA--[protein]-cysteine S-methyltransferase [Pseudomonadota bacterium]